MSLTIKCKYCAKEFGHPPLDIPPMPAPIPMALFAVIGKLNDHMQRKHPGEYQGVAGAARDFHGLVLFSMYNVEDPSLKQRIEETRQQILGHLGVIAQPV